MPRIAPLTLDLLAWWLENKEHIPQMATKWWSFIVNYHGRMRKKSTQTSQHEW